MIRKCAGILVTVVMLLSLATIGLARGSPPEKRSVVVSAALMTPQQDVITETQTQNPLGAVTTARRRLSTTGDGLEASARIDVSPPDYVMRS